MKQYERTGPDDNLHRRSQKIREHSRTTRNIQTCEHKDIFGANIQHKPDDVIRIGFKNIHGFPNPSIQQVKYDTLQAESSEHGFNFDLQSYIETNKRWNKVHHSQHIRELTKGWWEKPSFQLSWLKDNEENTIQFGGVATITNKYMTSCRFNHGVDDMGRWTWTTLRGKKGVKTTIISAYRPCKSENEQSVEMQQLQYLRNKGIHTDPLATFDANLKELIEEKIKEGHKVILMGDFNVPVNKRNQFTSMLSDLGLKEIITTKYNPEQGRSTFRHGSNIIDGIWSTDDLEMIQGGYEDLLSHSGDHCWVWADFSTESVLGHIREPFTQPITRKLNCKLPPIKEKFQKLLDQEYKRHCLKQRLETYIDRYTKEYTKTGQITTAMKNEYDKLLQLSEDAIKYADKNCKKARTGKVPFSPTTKKLQGEVVMWKSVLRYKFHCKRKNLRLLLRQSKRWGFKEQWGGLSIQEIKEKLKLAKLQYRRFKPTATEERRTFLGKLAQDYADRDSDGKDKEHFLRELIRQEDERASFARIRMALKPARGSVTRVEKENNDGTRQIISDKYEMEKEIGRVNVEKLLQANNTPLRQEPLRSTFGEHGDFDKWNDIVDGKLNLPYNFQADKGTKLWINKIQSMKTEATTTSWTPEEYTAGWRKMKEETTSAPGPSFSHYKAAEKGSTASIVHSLLAISPLLFGFAPTAWCKAVASMIPKKKEDLRPAKLRLITLLHALFNHNNKWVGREMMKYGEKHELLAKEQYGGRKKKSAGQHALNKRLILDFLRIQKLSAIIIANDAVSCYDRIIIMVSYITMLIFGIMRETAKCLLSCLIVMVYRIRTVYGDSEFTYGGSEWSRTPHGNGQGNGSGPALWNGISSPLFDILREQNFGVHLQAPISRKTLHITGFGFVDDADLIQGAKRGQSIHSLLQQSQAMLTLWEEILRVTGGALDVKDKSDWSLISFKWKQGIATMRPMNLDYTLAVRDHADDLVTMKQIAPTDARETLGVMQSPSGTEDPEVQYLQQKVKQWVNKIQHSSLQRQDVRKATQMTIMRTLRYGMIATALSYDQCDLITKQLIRGVLPKLGIIRTANTKLATATTAMRGVGLIHLYILQLVDHLKVLCNHGGEDTETGILLRNELEALMIQNGQGGSPFDITPKAIPWIEHCWWRNTLEATHHYQIQIQGKTTVLHKWMKNDSFLMTDFARKYNPQTHGQFLQSLNRVRLFLQVATRSDIQMACGWRCNPKIFDINISEFTSCSKHAYEWPDQGRPSKADFQNWQIAIDEVYGVRSSNQSFRPEERGEIWLTESINFHHWRFDRDRMLLFQYNTSLCMWFQWTHITVGRTRSETLSFQRTNQTSEHVSEHYEIASVIRQNNTAKIISTGLTQQANLLRNNTEDDWVIQYLVLPEDGGAKFAAAVANHNGKTAGDGSCKDGRATGGFVSFTDDDIQGGIEGATEIPLTEDACTPYSGELGGIQVAIATTHKVCKEHGVQTGTITHGVDNNAALRNCFGTEEPDTSTPCFHLVKRIRSEIKKSPFTWIGKKVKAHQDDNKEYDQLTIWEKANVKADEVAKQHLARIQNQPRPKYKRADTEGWTIAIDGKILTTKFEKKIIAHCTEKDSKQYWIDRMQISEDAQKTIDWEIFKLTTSQLSQARQLFILKHSAGVAATGRNMVRRRERSTDECPRCGRSDEHTEHIVRCPNKEAREIFLTHQEEISSWLIKTTSQDLRIAISILLSEYINDSNRPGTEEEIANDDVIQTMNRQRDVGLYPWICGFMCSDWAKLQAKHFEDIGSRRCAKRWTAQLAEKLINMIFDLWTHRNEVLHKKDNTITEKIHNETNETIATIFSQIPNMRLLTEAERRFFKSSTIQKTQERNIHRKRQWIRKAESILTNFTSKHNNNSAGDAHILFRAMGINKNESDSTISKHQKQTKMKKYDKTKKKRSIKIQIKRTPKTRKYMSRNKNIRRKGRFNDSG